MPGKKRPSKKNRDHLRMEAFNKQKRRPVKCEGCETNYADFPSKLCPGCQAYKEHQS